ncbi:hypothetical protein HPB50_007596 [Hyalomma asiaticum]|uniref:Uncharacterized protein n=1 Tax=Hyalomma asiaticum TaxID=266040 RepID=A0ACB7T8Q1_HYAAI|nr:hypothetical protein HPB50_007596 [Hyalomma asiaticum]
MRPQFFYSATRARRPLLVALEDADEMFAQLKNGNLSDVGDSEDEEDDDFIFEEAGSDDCALETRETSDELGREASVQRNVMIESCKSKPRIKCEMRNVHLCLTNRRNCFREFHVHH